MKKALATPTDWVKMGAVTPVKNQGPHGYCGTFGRVGSAEGQWALRSGKGPPGVKWAPRGKQASGLVARDG